MGNLEIFADFVPIFAEELKKSIEARKPIAEQIAEVGRVQIRLNEASMRRITEETVNQLRNVYQQLNITLASFGASVRLLAQRRGIPQGRRGGLVRGPSHEQGGVLANLEGGEIVIPKMQQGGAMAMSAVRRHRERRRQMIEADAMGTGHLGYGAGVAVRAGGMERRKGLRPRRGPGPQYPAHIEVLRTLRREFRNEIGARNANRYLNQNYGVPLYDPATGGYPNLEAARRQYRQDQVLTRDGSGFPSGGRSPDEIMRGELAAEDVGRRGRLATRRQGSALTNRQEMLQRNRAAYEQRKAARAQRPRGSRRYRAALLAQQRSQTSQSFLYGARRAQRRLGQGETLSREERRGLVQARAMLRRRRRFAGGGAVELEGGEYIINKRSAGAIGTSNLNKLNSYRHGGPYGNIRDLEEKGMSLPERNKQTVILEELKKNSTTSLKQGKKQVSSLGVISAETGGLRRAATTQGSIFTHDTGTHKRLDTLINHSSWSITVKALEILIRGLKDKLADFPKPGGPAGAGPPKGAPKPLEDPLGVGEGKIRRDFEAARARFIAEGDDDPGTLFEFARNRRAEARERGRAMLRNNWRARGPHRPRAGVPNIEGALQQFDEDRKLLGFANGGFVRGPSHAQGGVPALLEGGEYVIPKRFATGGPIKDPEMEAAQRKHQSLWGIGAIMDIIANTSTYWGSRALGAIDQPSRHPDSRANERGGRYFSVDHAKQAKLMEKQGIFNPAAISRAQVEQKRQGTPTMGMWEEFMLSSLDMFMPGMGAAKVSKMDKVARSGSMWRRLSGRKGKQTIGLPSPKAVDVHRAVIAASLNPKDRPTPLPKFQKGKLKQPATGIETGNVSRILTTPPNLQKQLGGQFAAEQMTLRAMHADIIRLVDDLSLPVYQGAGRKLAKNMAELKHGFRVRKTKLYSFGPEKLNMYRRVFPHLGDDFGVRLGRDLGQSGGVDLLGGLYSQHSGIAEEIVMSKGLFKLGAPRSGGFSSTLVHELQHLATKGSNPEEMGGVLRYLRNRGEIISFAKQAAYEFALSNPKAKRFKMSKSGKGDGSLSNSKVLEQYKEWGRLRRANTEQDEALMMHRVARPGQNFVEWPLSEQAAGRYFKEISEFFYDNVMAPMVRGSLSPIPQRVPKGFASGGLVQYRQLGGIMNPMGIMGNLMNQLRGMRGGLFGQMQGMGRGARQGAFGGAENIQASLFGPRNAAGGPGNMADVLDQAMNFFFGTQLVTGGTLGGGAGLMDFVGGGGLANAQFGTTPNYMTPFGGGASFCRSHVLPKGRGSQAT